MRVKLVSHTQDPERICAAAALTSTNKSTFEDRLKSFEGEEGLEKARSLIKRIVSCGHETIIEHASFTFSAEDVSRALTHELVRHRIASYTQQSQRYISFDGVDPLSSFKRSEKIDKDEGAKKLFDEALEKCADSYKKMLEKGIPAEDARLALPNAMLNNITITMNARALKNFFRLRCCNRALWEIHELADEMLRQTKAVAPAIFHDSGPACVRGPCTEGKMSCGKMEEVREKYKNS